MKEEMNIKVGEQKFDANTPLWFLARFDVGQKSTEKQITTEMKNMMDVIEEIDNCVPLILDAEEKEGEVFDISFRFYYDYGYFSRIKILCSTKEEAMYAVNIIAEHAYKLFDNFVEDENVVENEEDENEEENLEESQ